LLQHGDFTIAESPAIVAYLSNTYGTRENALIPTDRREYATWLERCFYAATELDATSLYVMRRHGDLKHIYGEAPVALEGAAAYFATQLRHAEQALGDGRGFLVGDRLTTADILFTTCLAWAESYRIPVTAACRAYLEKDHVATGLPRRVDGQSAEDGLAASACRILLHNTASRREVGLQRQMSRTFRAGARMNMDLPRYKRLAACGAHHDRIEILAAQVMGAQQRSAFFAGHVDIAPVDDRHDDRVKIKPFLRQAVLITLRPLLVGDFDEHELVDEFPEPAGEDRAGDTKPLLEIFEPPHAQKAVP
jgi:glutathione S-transferase